MRKKLIDKDTLVAEIERLRMNYGRVFYEYDAGFSEGRSSAFDEVLSFLNTLEVKEVEEEPVSNNLKEASDNYVGHAPEIDEDLSCFIRRNAFIAGAQWKKEQMITKACVFLESTDFCKYYNKEFVEEFKKAMEK